MGLQDSECGDEFVQLLDKLFALEWLSHGVQGVLDDVLAEEGGVDLPHLLVQVADVRARVEHNLDPGGRVQVVQLVAVGGEAAKGAPASVRCGGAERPLLLPGGNKTGGVSRRTAVWRRGEARVRESGEEWECSPRGIYGRADVLQGEQEPEHHLGVVDEGSRPVLDVLRPRPLRVVEADPVAVEDVEVVANHAAEIGAAG